jgi:3-oxoacid CoA-transferase subunit B
MVVSDLAVFRIDRRGDAGMTLIELAPDVTLEELRAKTAAEFHVAL